MGSHTLGKGGRILVLDVDVNGWSGHGPSGMLNWLRKDWRTRQEEPDALDDD
jgi:hypothetical protein